MKKLFKLLTVFCLICSCNVFAQNNKSVKIGHVDTINDTQNETKNETKNNDSNETKKEEINQTIFINALESKTISKDIFDLIKNTDKSLVVDYNGSTITFNGKDIKSIKDINITIEISNVKNDSNLKYLVKNGIVVTFPDNGKLPGEATVNILLDDSLKNILMEEKIYLYSINEETNKLVFENDEAVKVDANHIEFKIDHNSKFLLSNVKLVDNEIKEEQNSKTSDNIKKYFILGIISISCIILLLKLKKNV